MRTNLYKWWKISCVIQLKPNIFHSAKAVKVLNHMTCKSVNKTPDQLISRQQLLKDNVVMYQEK